MDAREPTGKATARNDRAVVLDEQLLSRTGIAPGDEFLVVETDTGLLLRKADPSLRRVYVEPTNGCNLSCQACMRHSWHERIGFMSMDTYNLLIEGLRAIPSARSINFWGFGEPLLHPNISEMIALAKGIGAETRMITNGLRIDAPMARKLVSSGLDSIVVSVDGASPSIHAAARAGSDIDGVQRNVALLRSIRDAARSRSPEIGLEFVLTRQNVGEIKNLLELARSMEASFLVVSHILPYTEDMVEQTLYGASAGSVYPHHRSKWTPEVVLPRVDWRRELDTHILELLQHSSQKEFSPDRMAGSSGYCPFVNQGSLAVAWDGSVSPCVPLMHSYSCFVLGRAKSIRKCSFGNVGSENAKTIWDRADFRRFRESVIRFTFPPCTDCGGCDLSANNEEDCLGNGFPTCGDCLWAKGVIQCP